MDNINVISTSDSNIIVHHHRLWAVETTTDTSRFGPPTLPRDAPDSLYGRDEEFCQRDWPSGGRSIAFVEVHQYRSSDPGRRVEKHPIRGPRGRRDAFLGTQDE